MRHRDLRTTLGTYGHLDVEDLRAAVATLPDDPEQRRLAAAGAEASPFATRLLPDHGECKELGPAAPISPGATGPWMEREKGFEFRRLVNSNRATVHAFLPFRLSLHALRS